jgi:hypothetical protein
VFASPQVVGSRAPGSPLAIGLWARCVLAATGAILVGLLATAAMLKPEDRGFGTHQQLGLPPCSFKVLAGMRCPSCGMTTAWANLVRGRLTHAAAANMGGVVLGVTAIGLGPWALVSGIRGKWLWGRPRDSFTVALMSGIIAVTLIDWGIRVFLTG